jgi:predicted O-methyltransferase YrrM
MSEYPKEPLKVHLFRLLYRLSGSKPSVDKFLSNQLRYRRFIPEVQVEDAIPHFNATEIRISRCPVGAWSTPLVDVLVVLKAALGFRSKRILEIGSYRGDTARLLAENTPDDVRICTVDMDPQHGSSYRGTPVAAKIDRRIGKISAALFHPGEKFDLIFVDANHDYASVMNDTEVALQVLAESGVILWHDYTDEIYFHGLCAVPEALNEFAKRFPIAAIHGTTLAIHSTVNGWLTSAAIAKSHTGAAESAWTDNKLRG